MECRGIQLSAFCLLFFRIIHIGLVGGFNAAWLFFNDCPLGRPLEYLGIYLVLYCLSISSSSIALHLHIRPIAM
ncbi:hypothetical protein BDD12DRAFT_829650, partial [Trichophaea hybrida]